MYRRHLHFVGPGLVSSVAYIDPGNWATDLAAGANYGYKLLFVVLVAGLAAAGEYKQHRFGAKDRIDAYDSSTIPFRQTRDDNIGIPCSSDAQVDIGSRRATSEISYTPPWPTMVPLHPS